MFDFFNVDDKIVRMKTRYLQKVIEELAFADGKMAFVSGPRQSGKTTLGEMLAENRKTSKYYNWDDLDFRKIWSKSPKSVVPQPNGTPLVILDEIHKDRTWKRTLKGIYDTIHFEKKQCDFFVTGSARLNVYRRGSDSMLGRYYHFRLAPFSLREINLPTPLTPNDAIEQLFQRSLPRKKENQDNLEALLKFGPFPEPLFRQNLNKWKLWRQSRHEMVIREDLRDIGRSSDIGKIEMLAAILPDKVASPLSVNSLRLDIEVGHQTLQRWLGWLKELYFLFEIKPWYKKIARSLKKEGKIYLWDFSEVSDFGAKFENMVAMHLLKTCNYWNDTGQGDFELFYLRNREKQEIDFLIVRDKQPWLPIEVKRGDDKPSPNWQKFLPMLQCKQALQITEQPGWRLYTENNVELLVAGAAEALMYFA